MYMEHDGWFYFAKKLPHKQGNFIDGKWPIDWSRLRVYTLLAVRVQAMNLFVFLPLSQGRIEINKYRREEPEPKL